MNIENGKAKKMIRIDKQFSVSLILASAIFMISGSAATVHAITQTEKKTGQQ
jgi:hypothetical protein